MIKVELLVVDDFDVLFRFRLDREDSQFECLVIDLFEQSRIAFRGFVTLIDLASSFFLNHFTHHLLTIDDHGEVAYARSVWNREGIECFDDTIFRIEEDLIDFGDGNSVVDDYGDVLLFDLQEASEPTVGDK